MELSLASPQHLDAGATIRFENEGSDSGSIISKAPENHATKLSSYDPAFKKLCPLKPPTWHSWFLGRLLPERDPDVERMRAVTRQNRWTDTRRPQYPTDGCMSQKVIAKKGRNLTGASKEYAPGAPSARLQEHQAVPRSTRPVSRTTRLSPGAPSRPQEHQACLQEHQAVPGSTKLVSRNTRPVSWDHSVFESHSQPTSLSFPTVGDIK
ncbi:hypothetical protein PENANT_c058G00672 [Penicillium antarcticum]|uniref:Uncharacterized protein n=1 Tax=Penicillium antarcticum TaxID=416450 RepID=A0A1V6PR61_9EURO|nr:hypothetical protein PENANT_c058G00672 [Penicillium antarcticum]